MPLQAVLFDLGNTLIFPRRPWEAIWPQAIAALQATLQQAGIALDAARFRQQLQAYYQRRDESLRESGMDTVLQAALNTPLPTDQRRQALRAFYRITQQNWQVAPQAHPLLRRLRQAGLRLAVLSNAADDQDVQDMVKSFGLAPCLEFALTSAACGYRKPHPFIFQQALSLLQLPPQAVAMVGDRPSADLAGARGLGLRTIYLALQAAEPLLDPAEADAIASTLPQAGDILLGWQRQATTDISPV